MTLLATVPPGGAYLKVGILGFAGSGKTHTAMLLAIGARKTFNLEGPIAFFDTENSTPYVSARIEAETGKPLLAVKSRSLDDLKATVKECVASGVSVLIVDSVTHVWREVCDTYLSRINQSRKANRQQPLDRLDFQHWAALKSEAMWGGWTDQLLNSPLHIIVCGRAGYDYDFEVDEKGRKQLVKTGVKMKAEGEFGYEPSLVVEMTATQTMNGDVVEKIDHEALILKDRFDTINGKTFVNPTFAEFLPHIEKLKPTTGSGVDTTRKTDIVVDESGQTEWNRERRMRDVAIEELAGELDKAGLSGTAAEAKAKRARLLEECFGTSSKTALEGMRSDALRDGVAKARIRIAEMTQEGAK
jgi:hypothetical protein